MGVALTELLVLKEINLDSLSGKTLAVDAPMWLYQFLSSIRQRDGSLLTDSKGNVTSHLTGLLSRISNLSEMGIKLAFVFDGEPHHLKRLTLRREKISRLQRKRALMKLKKKKM